jgi:hypothetical protein
LVTRHGEAPAKAIGHSQTEASPGTVEADIGATVGAGLGGHGRPAAIREVAWVTQVTWEETSDGQGRVLRARAGAYMAEIVILRGDGIAVKQYTFRQGQLVWHQGKTTKPLTDLKLRAEKFLAGKKILP